MISWQEWPLGPCPLFPVHRFLQINFLLKFEYYLRASYFLYISHFLNPVEDLNCINLIPKQHFWAFYLANIFPLFPKYVSIEVLNVEFLANLFGSTGLKMKISLQQRKVTEAHVGFRALAARWCYQQELQQIVCQRRLNLQEVMYTS